MIEIKVLVDEARVGEFYEMFGRWLAGKTVDDTPEPKPQLPWGNTEEDLALAQVLWGKLSDRAKALFGVLMDTPEQTVSGEQLAEDLNIPNGKYGVAGVLAWPGRHCLAIGRALPVKYADGPVGESANYWMTQDVAALFRKARDSGA